MRVRVEDRFSIGEDAILGLVDLDFGSPYRL